MAWVKLDDRFAQHPKVVAAGPLAMAMQVAALGYCNRELTDGFVPRAIAKTLLDFEVERDGKLYRLGYSCGMAGEDVEASWVIDSLIATGMWEEVPGGYRIHDFHDYQPSREQALREREQTKQRVRAWRARNGVGNGVTNGRVTDAPVPVPQDVSETSSPLAGSRQRYPDAFEEFWRAYGATNGPKKPAFVAWQRLSKADKAEALAALPAWHDSQSWRDGFKPYPQKYLSQRYWEGTPTAGAKETNGNGHHANEPPENYGVVWDARKHYGSDGRKVFEAEVAAAKQTWEAAHS